MLGKLRDEIKFLEQTKKTKINKINAQRIDGLWFLRTFSK